jgi:hypothetical protein
VYTTLIGRSIPSKTSYHFTSHATDEFPDLHIVTGIPYKWKEWVERGDLTMTMGVRGEREKDKVHRKALQRLSLNDVFYVWMILPLVKGS